VYAFRNSENLLLIDVTHNFLLFYFGLNMFKKLIITFAAITALIIGGCGEGNKTSLLNDISGVWKAKSDNTLMTIQYSDKKVRLLFDDTFIPVTVGDIDEQNKTVNFNVTLNTGKVGVWTIRQIWDDKEKTSFHLGITLHDGSQDEFSFVRKVSTDDLNRLANLESKPETAALTPAVQQVAPANLPSTPVQVASTPEPLPQQQTTEDPSSESTILSKHKVSFDCTKAATDVEKLICSNQVLSQLDGLLGETFRDRMTDPAFSVDKSAFKVDGRAWIKKRNLCTDADCLEKLYRARIIELCEMPVTSGIHQAADCDAIQN
jgi:uncharacterized protein YecT (DUF1311 family)